nr:hypothetical protein [Tanacetum cinerariifolium]
MNSVINCLIDKSTWDDLILYHEGPSDVKESRVMDLKLCYNTFKFKESKTLTQTFTRYKALMNELVNDGIKLLKLEINTCFINGLPKKWLSFCQNLRNTNHVKDSKLASLYMDFQDYPDDEEDTRSTKYKKVKAKLALLSSSALGLKVATIKNKGLIVEAYEWYEEEVSSYDNEMVEVKVLIALVEKNDAISKEGSKNGEWVKISMRKCISEQIPSQKKRILRVDQLTKDLSSFGKKDLVFVKSSGDDTKVSIPGVEGPWLSKAEGFILPNHDTDRILPTESQRNTTGPSVVVTDSLATDYDSTDESLICSTPVPPLKKLDGAEPISRPKTIKSILRLKFTFKTETLKGFIVNEPSSALAKGNKSSSASKTLQL